MHRTLMTLTALGSFASLVACGGQADRPETDSLPIHLLASAQLGDGGSLEIHEPTPGEMVAIYVGKEASYGELFGGLDRGTVSYAELFRTITGREAPPEVSQAEARLVEAKSRMRVEDRIAADQENASAAPLANIGQSRSSLSASAFTASYCPSGWGYLYCLTSQTGNTTVTRTTISMYTYLNTTSGSVQHIMEYQNIFGNWVSYVNNTVPAGFLSYISRSGVWTTRRTRVTQAAGDDYHLSIYGTI